MLRLQRLFEDTLEYCLKITEAAPFDLTKCITQESALALLGLLFSPTIFLGLSPLFYQLLLSLCRRSGNLRFFFLCHSYCETTMKNQMRLKRWSQQWCLPLNPKKNKILFSMDAHQANLQPHLSLLTSPLRLLSVFNIRMIRSNKPKLVTGY